MVGSNLHKQGESGAPPGWDLDALQVPRRGPLEGLHVLDLTQLIAGPFCTKVLAQFGASVIKVERPIVGDACRALEPSAGHHGADRSLSFLDLNLNKAGMTLDLTSTEAKGVFARLVMGADVVVESGRPGWLARLGFSYERLQKLRADVILVSISNFGQTGPYRDLPASELVLYAMGHEMYGTGWIGEEPMSMAPRLNLCFAGQTAALATTAAVFGRKFHGFGEWIDVSIMETFLSSIDRRADSLVAYAYTGEKMKREGKAEEGLLPPYTRCKDGYIHMTVKSERSWRRLQSAVNEPWIRRLSYPWGDPEKTCELLDKWETWCAERPRLEVIAACQSGGVTCAPVNSIADLLDDPQLVERRFFRNVTHPVVGTASYAGLPFSLNDLSEAPWTPAPTLGQHTAGILADLGYTKAEIGTLAKSGAI